MRVFGVYWLRALSVMCEVAFRAGSHYSEVQQSRTSREWSNMIGYEMDSSLVDAYTTSKTSQVESFKHGLKTMATFFGLWEFSGGRVFWQPRTLGQET